MSEAKVEFVEPSGSDTAVYAGWCGHPVVLRFTDRETPRPGSTVLLEPDRDRVHLFADDDGTRVDAQFL